MNNKHKYIPDQVLIDILKVYEFGRQKDIKNLPNNLICERNGEWCTTWDRVLEIREQNKEIRKEYEASLGQED